MSSLLKRHCVQRWGIRFGWKFLELINTGDLEESIDAVNAK